MSDNMEQFSNAVHAAVEAAKSEHGNLGSRNAIRWAKGVAANKAIELAKSLPAGTFTGSPQKFVREKILNALENTGANVRNAVVSATELSITAGAAKAWLDARGLETPYGDGALVADIAIDKAYALRSVKEYEDAADALLTFADANDELTCKNLRKLTKVTNTKGKAVAQLIDDLSKLAAETSVPVSEVIKNKLAELSDEASVSTMRIDSALYEGDWADIRSHMGAIDQFLGFATEEKTGWTTNTRALERVISWFLPREYGFESLLNLFVENGEMTQAEAEAFKRRQLVDESLEAEFAADAEPDFDDEDEVEVEAAAKVKPSEPREYPSFDPVLDDLAQSDLPVIDTRLQSEMDDEFDFDDDPVYDDGPLPWE